MDRITVDDRVKSALFGSGEPLTLCDASGSAFGHFVPIVIAKGGDECPYSAEQLAVMQEESGGSPLADVWKSLGV
jgi:hypothetical protein